MVFQRNTLKIALTAVLIILLPAICRPEALPLSIEDLAYIFSTYFPKVEGSLARVENDRGTINLGKKNGLVKGIVLEIVRPGEPFFHPITHEQMGRFEEKIGYLEVESLDESESSGTLLFTGQKPESGDIARITSARIPVIITGESEKKNLVIIDEFSRSLALTDRFLAPPSLNMKNETRRSVGDREPIYEFKVQSFLDQRVQVELINLPFQHRIDELTTINIGNLQ